MESLNELINSALQEVFVLNLSASVCDIHTFVILSSLLKDTPALSDHSSVLPSYQFSGSRQSTFDRQHATLYTFGCVEVNFNGLYFSTDINCMAN